MDEQEQKNNQEGFLKQQAQKAKDKLKDDIKKKKSKEGLIKIFKALPPPAKIVIIAIIAAIALLLFLAMAFYVVEDDAEEKNNDAAGKAISTTYSASASTIGTDENGNTVNKIVVTTNENKTAYEIAYNDDADYLEDVKKELEDSIVDSASNFNNYELAVLGALMENGGELDYYGEEKLHCLPAFIKAESCTQNLDLRPNSEKQSGKNVGDYIDNYQPEKIENLGENEIPGVILVQRTNTNGTKVTLEYKVKSEFDELVTNNNQEAINYFTISDDGELIIAKYSMENKNVEIKEAGLPESVEQELLSLNTNGDKYTINSEKIAYSQYISKYTMPFEFLNQLLIITDDPEFCMKLVDYVLDSKIVINILEERIVTVTEEDRDYIVYDKDNKKIDYRVNAAGQQIVQEDNYFLKDDENNDCTNYLKQELFAEGDPTVTITTQYTTHSYTFGIIEADTWISKYTKTYANQTAVTEPTTNSNVEVKGQYEQIETEEEQPITDSQTINEDSNVIRFINETISNYIPKIVLAKELTISDDIYTDEDGNNYKKLILKYGNDRNYRNGEEVEYQRCYEIIDENGRGTGNFNLPETVSVMTEYVDPTENTKRIPPITYTFRLGARRDWLNRIIYIYNLQTPINPLLECIVSSLNIEKFQKVDFKSSIETTITRYPVDENPITKTHIYAKDENDNYEKFLVAYNESPTAINNLNSIESWLYEMMEEREKTVELMDAVKYLLYIYDGEDRGIAEIDTDLFNPSEFTSFNGGASWWWPIGSSNVETINGIKYAKGEPVSSTITSGVGPRWGENHGGIDISTGIRGTNIIASKAGTVIKVVDGFGDGYYGCQDGETYGNHIKIQHDDGTFAIYAHLEKGTIKVSQGDRVEQGQLLGGMGTSGSSTGIHLHFEIRDANNNILDPEEYVDPDDPRPEGVGNMPINLYNLLLHFEGGTQYKTAEGYKVFNNGVDDRLEVTCGATFGQIPNYVWDTYREIVGSSTIEIGDILTKEQYERIITSHYDSKKATIDKSVAINGITLSEAQYDGIFLLAWLSPEWAQGLISNYATEGATGARQYLDEKLTADYYQTRKEAIYNLLVNETYPSY